MPCSMIPIMDQHFVVSDKRFSRKTCSSWKKPRPIRAPATSGRQSLRKHCRGGAPVDFSNEANHCHGVRPVVVVVVVERPVVVVVTRPVVVVVVVLSVVVVVVALSVVVVVVVLSVVVVVVGA